MTQPDRFKDDIAKLARTDLLVVRQREGDAVALEHAAVLAGAAVDFVAVDLSRPETVGTMLESMVLQLRKDYPEVRPKVVISNDGPTALAALIGIDTRTELHEIVRLMSFDHATEVASMTARTALAFLIEIGQLDRFREVVAEAAREVDRLDAKGSSRL